MFRRSVVAWIVNLRPLLRRSQAKASAELVMGAISARRILQADVGRSMQTPTLAKHSIKRVSRFFRNNRVDVAEGCHGLVALAAKAADRTTRHWASAVSKTRGQACDFTIGRYMLTWTK